MQVRVIGRKGQAVLVEWQDEGYHRAHVPAEAMDGDECDPMELLMGIPYGLPWAEIAGDLVITGEQIEEQLRRHGIWTLEDLRRDPTKGAAALMAAHRQGVQTLIHRAITAPTRTETEGSEQIGGIGNE